MAANASAHYRYPPALNLTANRLSLVLIILLLTLRPGWAGTFVAFGPQTFIRSTGEPVTVQTNFSIRDPTAPYSIRVTNDGVTSAVISLNGVELFGPSDFGGPTSHLSAQIRVTGTNTLAVQLRGAPGNSLIIVIEGIDNVPPTISATATPPHNANGWNNTDVTVAFVCSDVTSGIASCPTPVTVSTDGPNQVVSGTAVDRAGNTAAASTSLNVDKTPPVVTGTSAPAANSDGWNNTPVVVTFVAADAVSGVDLSTLSAPVTFAVDGTNLSASGQAADLAGNIGSTLVSGINIDTVNPTLSATVTPLPNSSGWNDTPVSVHYVCADDRSGVRICPSDQTFTTEGSHEITAVAIDRAGNSSAPRATAINIDLTPPTIVISSPINESILSTSNAILAGTANDGLSGIATVTCNGVPATINTDAFSCAVTLAEGHNSVSVLATDAAGNSNSSTIGLSFQPGAGVGTLGGTYRSPAAITLGSPSVIRFTVSIFDATFVPGSAKLLRLSPSGTTTVIGQFHDDGLDGDDVANDKLYTYQLTTIEAAPGPVMFQVTADFSTATDVRSGFLPVFVQQADAAAQTLQAIGAQLAAGDIAGLSQRFLGNEMVVSFLSSLSPSDRIQLASGITGATLIESTQIRRTYAVQCSLSSGSVQFEMTLAVNTSGDWVIIAM